MSNETESTIKKPHRNFDHYDKKLFLECLEVESEHDKQKTLYEAGLFTKNQKHSDFIIYDATPIEIHFFSGNETRNTYRLDILIKAVSPKCINDINNKKNFIEYIIVEFDQFYDKIMFYKYLNYIASVGATSLIRHFHNFNITLFSVLGTNFRFNEQKKNKLKLLQKKFDLFGAINFGYSTFFANDINKDNLFKNIQNKAKDSIKPNFFDLFSLIHLPRVGKNKKELKNNFDFDLLKECIDIVSKNSLITDNIIDVIDEYLHNIYSAYLDTSQLNKLEGDLKITMRIKMAREEGEQNTLKHIALKLLRLMPRDQVLYVLEITEEQLSEFEKSAKSAKSAKSDEEK
jgi:hypothetical protein